MNASTPAKQPREAPDLGSRIRKRGWQIVIGLSVQAGLLFVAAGRLDWVWAWAFVGVYAGTVILITLIILPRSPELIAERGEIGKGERRDRVLGWLIVITGMAMLAVAGLDERYNWSPVLPLAVHLAALVLAVLGYALVGWSIVANRFFSSVVRIQDDRGHAVATGGPYRYVRHPGYVGYITNWLATALMLGSLWALIPAALVMILLVVRTALEDRTLLDELPGYAEYTQRTRYRLLPGVW